LLKIINNSCYKKLRFFEIFIIMQSINLQRTYVIWRIEIIINGKETEWEVVLDFTNFFSYGISWLRITKREEVKPVLEKALSIQGPVLIQFMIDAKENVLPQVPEGKPLNSFI